MNENYNESLTIAQACRLIIVDRETIYHNLKRGRLKFHLVDNRKYINRDDLIAWNNVRRKTIKYTPIILDLPVAVKQELEQPFCATCDGYGYYYNYKTRVYNECPVRYININKHGRT